MRQALMKWSNGAEVFAGKDARGNPLQGHNHAFFLPADDDDDGRLDHISVFARMAFDERAQRALGAVSRLWQSRNRPDLKVVLIGLGHPAAYGGFRVGEGQTPQLATARCWVSRTPFLLARHPHRRRDGRPRLTDDGAWPDGPGEQLCRLLQLQGYPEPVDLSPLTGTWAAGKLLRWLQFARERRGGPTAPTSQIGHGFRVEFSEPVAGPLAVGYACHFGLGQFRAEPE
jgi:CRISPR-associated protein Csb2